MESEADRLRLRMDGLEAQMEELRDRVHVLEGARPAEKARLEHRFGLVLINRIGALTVAIGLIFFFKYAVDFGWIGPAARIGIGLLAGLLLLGGAELLRRRQSGPLAQALAGARSPRFISRFTRRRLSIR